MVLDNEEINRNVWQDKSEALIKRNNMEYHTAERRKEPLPFMTAWIELENIMLSEISQSLKDKHHVFSPIRGI